MLIRSRWASVVVPLQALTRVGYEYRTFRHC